MIDQEQFIALTSKVVAELMPDEQIAFEVSAPEIAQALYQQGSIDGRRNAGNEFAFIETLEHTLTFVTLMAGTFETVRKLYTGLQGRNVDVTAVAVRWREELKAAGLAAETVERVVDKFKGDLGKLVSVAEGK